MMKEIIESTKSENKRGSEIDWLKDVYVDRTGNRWDLKEIADSYSKTCVSSNPEKSTVLQIPKAEDVLAQSKCISEKKAAAQAEFDNLEVARILQELPNTLRKAAREGKTQAGIAVFDKPELPKAYDKVVKALQDNGYKTPLVFVPTGEEVKDGKPVPSHSVVQIYALVAKFEK